MELDNEYTEVSYYGLTFVDQTGQKVTVGEFLKGMGFEWSNVWPAFFEDLSFKTSCILREYIYKKSFNTRYTKRLNWYCYDQEHENQFKISCSSASGGRYILFVKVDTKWLEVIIYNMVELI